MQIYTSQCNIFKQFHGLNFIDNHCYICVITILWLERFLLQAYAAGCDIVILASDFQRVQIIAGVLHDNLQVTCIDCCTDVGKVTQNKK